MLPYVSKNGRVVSNGLSQCSVLAPKTVSTLLFKKVPVVEMKVLGPPYV